jgi:hypothetical protein
MPPNEGHQEASNDGRENGQLEQGGTFPAWGEVSEEEKLKDVAGVDEHGGKIEQGGVSPIGGAQEFEAKGEASQREQKNGEQSGPGLANGVGREIDKEEVAITEAEGYRDDEQGTNQDGC